MAWAPPYVDEQTLAEFLSAENADVILADDTPRLTLAAAAASRSIDDFASGAVRRQFGKVDAPEQRVYPILWNARRGVYWCEIDDLMDTTGLAVTVDGTTVDVADVVLEPRNALAEDRPYTRMVLPRCGREAAIVAAWGWLAVPATITEATLIQAGRFFARKTALFGVAGSPDAGSELRLLARVDPDVAVMIRLGGYRRRPAVG